MAACNSDDGLGVALSGIEDLPDVDSWGNVNLVGKMRHVCVLWMFVNRCSTLLCGRGWNGLSLFRKMYCCCLKRYRSFLSLKRT
jgi:hypothetical protein